MGQNMDEGNNSTRLGQNCKHGIFFEKKHDETGLSHTPPAAHLRGSNGNRSGKNRNVVEVRITTME
jgi:hypothetical protein